jgi:hypothetical protein
MGRERYDGRWGAVPCGRSSQLFVSMQPSELFSPRFCRVRFPVASYLQLIKHETYKTSESRGRKLFLFLHHPHLYIFAISMPGLF